MVSRGFSVKFGKNEYGASNVNKMRAFYLTATLPLRAGIDIQQAGSFVARGDVTGVDLLESLVGSSLLIPVPKRGRQQVPYLVPSASTLSQLVAIARHGGQRGTQLFDLAINPFRLTKDSLMIYYIFNVNRLYEALWRYLLVKLSDELKRVTRSSVIATYQPPQGGQVRCMVEFPTHEEYWRRRDELDEEFSEGGVVDLIRNFLDPKAVLKAITHPHIGWWSLAYDSANRGQWSPYFTQPITYLSFSVSIPPELITSIVEGIKAGSDNQIVLRYLRLRLPLLDILSEEVFDALHSSSIGAFAAIVKGYCSMILRYFHKIIRRASITSTIWIKLEDLAHALSFALIEMGVHGISHCLMRYLASSIKVDESIIREFVGIAYGSPVVRQGRKNDLYAGVVDGYIFRFIADTSVAGPLVVIAGAILPLPYSRSAFGDSVKVLGIGDLLRYCGVSTSDPCYASWLLMRAVAKAAIRGVQATGSRAQVACQSIRGTPLTLRDVIEEVKGITESRFDLSRASSPADVERALYLSRERYRHVLIRKALSEAIKNLVHGSAPKKVLRNCIREAADGIRPYAPMLYEALVPHCFDGCYNCVLVRNCGTRHPTMREWLVSKSMMKIVLTYAARQPGVTGHT